MNRWRKVPTEICATPASASSSFKIWIMLFATAMEAVSHSKEQDEARTRQNPF